MSVLETPRLVFRGRLSWDPIVTNNAAAQYDESQSETVFSPPAVNTATFRQAAVRAVGQGVNWNPDGTHRSRFFDTKVVGVDLGRGLATDDPIVGTPVSFLGMLVDLEPYGSYSSQLFFDAMTFGIDGGCQVQARRETRMIARYINFNRYQPEDPKDPKQALAIAGVASVVWQTSFPKANLKIGANRSPTLSRFLAAFEDPDVLGLTVRWVAYRTGYFDTLDAVITASGRAVPPPELYRALHDKLLLGGFQPNPARSELVGVLGLWRQGEPMSEPGDRALLSAPSDSPQGVLLSTVHARASADTLTLDLSNAVPEIDKTGTKMDLGDLVVTARSPGPVVATMEIGRIRYADYGREAYEAGAGIVTLHSPGVGDRVKDMDLAVTCPDNRNSGLSSLAEAPLRAIPERPNLYLDEGETTSWTVRVLERGRPAPAGVAIDVVMTGPPSWNTFTGPPVSCGETDARGMVSLPLVARGGNIQGYMFIAHGAPVPKALDTQRTPYGLVRTLPADGSIAAKPPTWANVYGSVLQNWNAMAPCMDNWLRLDDETQVKSFTPVLKRLTDKANFESFLYMPVTRDMTAGSRTLLYTFLDGPSAAAVAAVEPAPERRQATLSRSLRRG